LTDAGRLFAVRAGSKCPLRRLAAGGGMLRCDKMWRCGKFE
jgi:hypothetical protein